MQAKRSTSFKALQLAIAISIVFALPAMAQSSVTASGVVDTYVGSMKYSGNDKRTSVVGSGGMTTSWIGFYGTEDLGNGLKANFKLTSFFRSDKGQTGRFYGNETLFSRDAHDGLSGNV
ncbi:MAG: porin, partial [Glaciimonas sp.]|nr:porin [Glaciimonas sp.]